MRFLGPIGFVLGREAADRRQEGRGAATKAVRLLFLPAYYPGSPSGRTTNLTKRIGLVTSGGLNAVIRAVAAVRAA